MGKKDDIEDLLGDTGGDTKKPAKKADAKAEKAPAKGKKEAAAAPEKKAATKKAKAEPAPAKGKAKKEAAEPKERAKREPVTFAEGERDELIKQIKKLVKKPINSKDLAAKMEIPTRKLRPVLYSAQSQGIVSLTSLGAPVLGMEVAPA